MAAAPPSPLPAPKGSVFVGGEANSIVDDSNDLVKSYYTALKENDQMTASARLHACVTHIEKVQESCRLKIVSDKYQGVRFSCSEAEGSAIILVMNCLLRFLLEVNVDAKLAQQATAQLLQKYVSLVKELSEELNSTDFGKTLLNFALEITYRIIYLKDGQPPVLAIANFVNGGLTSLVGGVEKLNEFKLYSQILFVAQATITCHICILKDAVGWLTNFQLLHSLPTGAEEALAPPVIQGNLPYDYRQLLKDFEYLFSEAAQIVKVEIINGAKTFIVMTVFFGVVGWATRGKITSMNDIFSTAKMVGGTLFAMVITFLRERQGLSV